MPRDTPRLPTTRHPLPTADCRPPTARPAPAAVGLATTASGRLISLVAPRPEDVDWGDVAAGLGRQTRFNGQTQVTFYSVAEHSIRGAAVARSPKLWSPWLAARLAGADIHLVARAFILHDAQEYVLGDITTPSAGAIAALADEIFGARWGGGAIVRAAIAEAKRRLDVAIHLKAGLPWPLPAAVARAVKALDAVMLSTEQLHLCARPPSPFDAPPLSAPICKPLQPGAAEAAFLDALEAEGWGR